MAASNAIKAIGISVNNTIKKQRKTAKKRKNSYFYHLIGSFYLFRYNYFEYSSLLSILWIFINLIETLHKTFLSFFV